MLNTNISSECPVSNYNHMHVFPLFSELKRKYYGLTSNVLKVKMFLLCASLCFMWTGPGMKDISHKHRKIPCILTVTIITAALRLNVILQALDINTTS